jgi:hypothetical protein
MEQPVPSRLDSPQYGAALWDPVHSVLQGKPILCLMFLPFQPPMQEIFSIAPLNWEEWKAVLYLSAPVLVLEEMLKFISVRINRPLFRAVTNDVGQITFIEPPTRKPKID